MNFKTTLISSILVFATLLADAKYKTYKFGDTVIDAKKDLHLVADGITNDSRALNEAISSLSANGGGTIYLPKGEYVINNIGMQSNIRLQIEAGSILYMGDEGKYNNCFGLSGGTEGIKNVVIEGVNGKFTLDLTKSKKEKMGPFFFRNVKNFMIKNVHIKDVKTQFPLMTFVPNLEKNEDLFGPTDGTIMNCSSENSHYGYGLVQAHAGKRLHFQNLEGEGGTIFRLETGEKKMNDAQFGGLFDITAKNIKGKNGNSTVMIAPHSMHNGVFHIENVISESCGAGVRVEGGYVSKKYSNPDLDGGSFEKGCTIKNVKATFGLNAQIKTKHWKYMPIELFDKVPTPVKNISEPAPSIAAVLLTSGSDNVEFSKVEAIGFTNDAIVTRQAHNSSIKTLMSRTKKN